MDKLAKRPNTQPTDSGAKARRPPTIEPAVSVYEADDKIIVELEMPGVERDKIDVTVERDELSVTGWRKVEEENNGEILHQERPKGCYRRSFILGESIDSSRVTAAYENGILRLTLPKAEAAKPKRIAIS